MLLLDWHPSTLMHAPVTRLAAPDIPSFPYRLLWQERVVRSVANLTRQDAREFLALAPGVPVKTQTRKYELPEANRALSDLRGGHVQGAAVLIPG